MVQFVKSDVVSAWIKSMRFSDYESASYWFIILAENEVSEEYLAKRLSIFSAEDCFDSQLMVLANSVYQMYHMGLGDSNMLWQVMFRCCKSQKFWEVPDGQEYELVSNAAMKRYKTEGIEPVPQWSVDRHTSLYHQLQSEGRGHETDSRFGGSLKGRLHMVWMYQKYGRIDPNIHDDELLAYAEQELKGLDD